MRKIKVTLTINEDVRKKSEAYAKENGLSLSAFASLAMSDYLRAQETLKSEDFQDQLRELKEAVESLQK